MKVQMIIWTIMSQLWNIIQLSTGTFYFEEKLFYVVLGVCSLTPMFISIFGKMATLHEHNNNNKKKF